MLPQIKQDASAVASSLPLLTTRRLMNATVPEAINHEDVIEDGLWSTED